MLDPNHGEASQWNHSKLNYSVKTVPDKIPGLNPAFAWSIILENNTFLIQ